MTLFHDIEAESLPAHVSICQQRYLVLESRLETVEKRIEKIEELVKDIHTNVSNLNSNQKGRWIEIQWWIIGLLTSAVGFLLSRLIF